MPMNLKLVKYIFLKLVIISSIYLTGFIAFMTLLLMVFNIFGVLSEGKSIPLHLVVLSSNSFFVPIIGFVMPLMMFRRFVELGITRRQYSLAFSSAGVGIALCFTLIAAIASISSGGTEIAALAALFARHCAAFAVGWLAASGYLLRRIVPAIASSLLLCLLAFNILSYISIVNDFVWALLYIAVFLFCTFVTVKVMHYAPIKA